MLRAPHLVYNPKLISGVSKLLKTFDKPHGFISKTALEKKMEQRRRINIEHEIFIMYLSAHTNIYLWNIHI